MMRIRRWRRYQPTANPPCDDDLDAETTPQTSSGPSTRPLALRIGVEFINTVHPRQITSSATISSVRSHVARDIHASRRASALQPTVDAKTREMQFDTVGASQLAATWPANLIIPVYNGLFHGFVRPITKLEHFLLDYCKRQPEEQL